MPKKLQALLKLLSMVLLLRRLHRPHLQHRPLLLVIRNRRKAGGGDAPTQKRLQRIMMLALVADLVNLNPQSPQ